MSVLFLSNFTFLKIFLKVFRSYRMGLKPNYFRWSDSVWFFPVQFGNSWVFLFKFNYRIVTSETMGSDQQNFSHLTYSDIIRY